jgi:hypothetical protein
MNCRRSVPDRWRRLDLIAEYEQNKHVSYGFGLAHLFTGRYLNETTKGKDYNYPFAYATYIF